jgi:hypothetical protein
MFTTHFLTIAFRSSVKSLVALNEHPTPGALSVTISPSSLSPATVTSLFVPPSLVSYSSILPTKSCSIRHTMFSYVPSNSRMHTTSSEGTALIPSSSGAWEFSASCRVVCVYCVRWQISSSDYRLASSTLDIISLSTIRMKSRFRNTPLYLCCPDPHPRSSPPNSYPYTLPQLYIARQRCRQPGTACMLVLLYR